MGGRWPEGMARVVGLEPVETPPGLDLISIMVAYVTDEGTHFALLPLAQVGALGLFEAMQERRFVPTAQIEEQWPPGTVGSA